MPGFVVVCYCFFAKMEKWNEASSAAREGNTDVLENCLLDGVGVDDQDSHGRTLLWIASEEGQVQVVEKLIHANADVEKQQKNRYTPLDIAAENGHLEIVELLIRAGANIGKQQEEESGPTYHPLDILGTPFYFSTCVETLVPTKAEPNVCTPIYIAARNGHAEIVEKLIKEKADVEQKQRNGWTPLHIAAKYGHAEIVDQLIRANANIERHQPFRSKALHIAAWQGHVRVVQRLIQAKADINSQNNAKETPLIVATKFGNQEVAKELLKAGANVEAKDTSGATALFIAAKQESFDLVNLLVPLTKDAGSQRAASQYAVKIGDNELLRLCAITEDETPVFSQESFKMCSVLGAGGFGCVRCVLETAESFLSRTFREAVPDTKVSANKILDRCSHSLGMNPKSSDWKNFLKSTFETEEERKFLIRCIVEMQRATILLFSNFSPGKYAEFISGNRYSPLRHAFAVFDDAKQTLLKGHNKWALKTVEERPGLDLRRMLSEVKVMKVVEETWKNQPSVDNLLCPFLHYERAWVESTDKPMNRLSHRQPSCLKILMELGNQSLRDFLQRRSVRRKQDKPLAFQIIHELLTGVSFIHKCGIIHRDLKPENILLNVDNHVKIADFGIATTVGISEDDVPAYRSRKGELKYMAPEIRAKFKVMEDGEKKARYDHRIDLFSLGLVIFEILYGKDAWRRDPFHIESHFVSILENVSRGLFPDDLYERRSV